MGRGYSDSIIQYHARRQRYFVSREYWPTFTGMATNEGQSRAGGNTEVRGDTFVQPLAIPLRPHIRVLRGPGFLEALTFAPFESA